MKKERTSTSEFETPSADPVIAMVRGRLSVFHRWLYRSLLVFTVVVQTVIISLWLTEPKPLPLRLHLAFASLMIVGLLWITVFSRILQRQLSVSSFDRLMARSISVVACSIFLILGLPIAIMRGSFQACLTISLFGGLFLAIAVYLLLRALATHRRLQQRKDELIDSES